MPAGRRLAAASALVAAFVSTLLTPPASSVTAPADCPQRAKMQLGIGALFNHSLDGLLKRNAFYFALTDVRQRMTAELGESANLSSSIFCRHELEPIVKLLSDSDVFQTSQAVCQMLEEGAVALIGPDNAAGSPGPLAASVSSLTRMPQLELQSALSTTEEFMLHLYPSVDHISRCLIDIVDYFRWQEVLVVYENEESLFRLENVFSNRRDTKALYFRIKRYIPAEVYSLLKEVGSAGWTKIIVDLSLQSTAHFLRAATNKGLMNRDFHFVLANLDASTLSLNDYGQNGANLTLMRVLPGDAEHYGSVLSAMRTWTERHQRVDSSSYESVGILTQEGRLGLGPALVYDAVQLLASALTAFSNNRRLHQTKSNCSELFLETSSQPPLPTETHQQSQPNLGASLMSHLRSANLSKGLTGRMQFSGNSRSDLSLELLHLQPDGLKMFANWTQAARGRLHVIREPFDLKNVFPLKNKVLRVVAVATQPFIWIKREYRGRYLDSNDKVKPDVEFHRQHLEGFCIDMMELIANRTGLEWTIYRAPDGNYGSCEPVGPCSGDASQCPCEWNGIMLELIEGRADIALGSFTITYEREKVIDFTKPFMNLGISILFKKPKSEKPGLFSFLNPLAVEIWLYVLAAYIVVTLMIYALARFSPYEWLNPHPCREDSDYLVNTFSLSNSFWFTVATLMQQGSDVNPRAASTRLVSSIWWFFTLIIISSYTANLAAFLTVERMVSPIESAEDLVKQSAIEYGVLSGGSTETFFDASQIDTYKTMANYMKERPYLKPKTTEQGIERVKKGGYAFLMESAMIEYHVERECKLVQVGGLIDSKGYGIGVRPNREKLRDELTLKILELQRDQELQTLKNRWWKETGACRGQDPKESAASALDMHNVGGIFLVLVCGLVLAVLVALVEFVWNSRKHAEAGSQPLCAEMSNELRFSLNCYASSKKRIDSSNGIGFGSSGGDNRYRFGAGDRLDDVSEEDASIGRIGDVSEGGGNGQLTSRRHVLCKETVA
ncbi:hypothetical protein BOX15_Mlig020012g1 [Macrostomum lignano]|uniref:PBPe domain-containing protein n=1 Tax=Macrostomum lignano TaxID=282301 RepID=A0A267H7Y3_9PLAT|nr:hypothetical protein BOX15_Mlig020012g1 [Macrostomum lignano]